MAEETLKIIEKPAPMYAKLTVLTDHRVAQGNHEHCEETFLHLRVQENKMKLGMQSKTGSIE
jgi:hypothetical protein